MIVEAVVIFPLVAAFLAFILLFTRVMQVETEVQEALYYAGRLTAAEAVLSDSPTALRGTAEILFRKELAGRGLKEQYLYGGSLGISLMKSDFSGDMINLRADYRIRIPVPFLPINGISIVQHSVTRKWTGRDVEREKADPYVYFTDYGSVYHSSESCSYLNLKINSTSVGKMSSLRSSDGSVYYACSSCGAAGVSKGTVYYAVYGNRYHRSLSCSGLKRTIHMVRRSALSGMKGCSKCTGGS